MTIALPWKPLPDPSAILQNGLCALAGALVPWRLPPAGTASESNSRKCSRVMQGIKLSPLKCRAFRGCLMTRFRCWCGQTHNLAFGRKYLLQERSDPDLPRQYCDFGRSGQPEPAAIMLPVLTVVNILEMKKNQPEIEGIFPLRSGCVAHEKPHMGADRAGRAARCIPAESAARRRGGFPVGLRPMRPPTEYS